MGKTSLSQLGGWMSITPQTPAYLGAVIPLDLSAPAGGPARSRTAALSGAASQAVEWGVTAHEWNRRKGGPHWLSSFAPPLLFRHRRPADRTTPPPRRGRGGEGGAEGGVAARWFAPSPLGMGRRKAFIARPAARAL